MPYTLSLRTATWEPGEWLAIFQSTHSVQAALTWTGGNLANITHVDREARINLKLGKIFVIFL